jgi:hypothetical protein
MTYGRVRVEKDRRMLDGAAVSHSAELVRGDCCAHFEGPLIRPISPEASLRLDGAPSPQGEKGPPRWPA